MDRATWYRWHSWLGIKLAIFLCFIIITGTIATVSNEIDWLTNSAIRAPVLETNENIAWPEIYQDIINRNKASNNTLVSISAPLDPGFAVMAVVINEKQQRKRLYYDPQSGNYQGDGTWMNWQVVLRRLHRHLMLPLDIGLTLVSATSILFIASFISGLVIHRQWLKGLVKLPRKKNKRVYWGDMHRITGLWSSWLLFITAITSVWYLIEHFGGQASYPSNAKVISEQALANATLPTMDAFNTIIQASRETRPELQIDHIRFPNRVAQPVIIEGQADTILVRDRANNMAYDPASGDLLSVRYGDELSIHVRISEAADPLHFGTWASYTSKLIYFIFGIILSIVSVSGTYSYILRINCHKPYKELKTSIKIKRAIDKVGNLFWVSLIITLIAIVALNYQVLAT